MTENEGAAFSPKEDLPSTEDLDRVRTEASSEELRRDLRRFFEWRCCLDPEDLVQEVVFRALKRVSEGARVYADNPRSYFFGIARNLVKEGWKSPRRREEMMDPDEWDRRASSSRDLEQAEANMVLGEYLDRVSPPEGQLIVRYYTEDRSALSQELGISPGNLRVQVHRIRRKLLEPPSREPALAG